MEENVDFIKLKYILSIFEWNYTVLPHFGDFLFFWEKVRRVPSYFSIKIKNVFASPAPQEAHAGEPRYQGYSLVEPNNIC